ncbi:MAG TPA: hypothetical protein VII92_15260 [Anaerolineae bacterium]
MKKTTKPQSKILKETHLEYYVDSGHAGRKRAATKTDITIPGAVFESAQKLAQKMNMSLSEFYTVALTNYISEQQTGDVPVVSSARRQFGSAEGLIVVADDFDAPLPDFAEHSA